MKHKLLLWSHSAFYVNLLTYSEPGDERYASCEQICFEVLKTLPVRKMTTEQFDAGVL